MSVDIIPIRPRLLNIAQACDYVGGLSQRAFYDFRKRWSLRAVKLSPQEVRFDLDDLNAAIDRARSASAPDPKPN